MNRLPSRIATVMIGTILIFVLMLGTSVLWLTGALDSQAHANTERQVRRALDDLLGRTEIQTFDYAKWDLATQKVAELDLAWFDENFGASAVMGEAMQLAVVWGGPLSEDRGWTMDGAERSRTGLFDPALFDLAERRLAEVPLAVYEGTSFFAWHDGGLFAVAAARVELPGAPFLVGPPPPDAEMARLIMGQRLGDAMIEGIADSFLLTGLRVAREAAPGVPSVPLLGGADEPVAYLAWDPPRPGSTKLRQMAPPLLTLGLLAVGLAAFGMALVRRSAQHLVVAERQASSAARTDALTGLPNRAAFNEALAAPARAGERAVLFLDVDDFKRINDSIGHEAGDQAIVRVAERLARLATPGSRLARIAGDEFVFVVEGGDAEALTRRLAEAAAAALLAPFSVLGHQMRIRMAMGYALQAADDTTGADLVRQADLAMYEAKRHRDGAPVAFSAVIEQASRDALVIEQGLRRALAGSDEITMAYQPIVCADGRLAHAEALARWTSPELGPVPPDRFIAVAEQAGLIVELGRKLFQLVCDDLVAHPGLAVSVNISTLQLMAPDFIPSLTAELASRGVAASRIEVELTEGVLVDDSRLAAERLRELRAAGFSTALDDFGTGYSSVGYLEQLDFQTLKIDRSFVSKVRASERGIAVVQGMITMAHGLGLRVVCEGVETACELELLRDLGCDLAQGYHLDRPLPIQALAARWLGRQERAAVA